MIESLYDWVGCMFLGSFLFLLGCPIYWHIIVHSSIFDFGGFFYSAVWALVAVNPVLFSVSVWSPVVGSSRFPQWFLFRKTWVVLLRTCKVGEATCPPWDLLATGENVGPPSAMLCQPEGGAMCLKWNLSSFPPKMVFLGLCGPGFSLTPSFLGFLHSSVGGSSACNAGDLGLIPGLGRSPGEGNGNPLQYSCLENPMDRGAWQATVHGVTRVRHD